MDIAVEYCCSINLFQSFLSECNNIVHQLADWYSTVWYIDILCRKMLPSLQQNMQSLVLQQPTAGSPLPHYTHGHFIQNNIFILISAHAPISAHPGLFRKNMSISPQLLDKKKKKENSLNSFFYFSYFCTKH